MTVRLTRLPNGIRVISDSMDHLETISVGAWVDVGARYEPKHLNGISHLLEHMAFKGTKRRTARQLAEEIESVGGYLNAFTSREHTNYYARVLKNDMPLAVDILADILQNSTIDESELAREKDVIIQEIGQVRDTPDDLVFDHLQEIAFPEQPLGRSILGSLQSVTGFRREAVRSYMHSHYRGESLVISAAGNLDHEQLVSLVENNFDKIQTKRDRIFDGARYQGGESRVSRPLEQLHLALGFPSIAYDHDDYFALQVYCTILGGGMSSRLFQEIREDLGLAYSIYSFSASHADTGLLGVYVGTSPTSGNAVIPVIAGEMKKLAIKVGAGELARARAQLKAGLFMSLESCASRAEQLGRQMLVFDRPIESAELVEKVEAVDDAAVTRMAAQILEGPLSLALVGDDREFTEFDEVRANFQTVAEL